MLRGRRALVSVYLCFVWLLAMTPQQVAKLCTVDTIARVNFLIRRAPNLKWLDCRLYTPTIDDYQNCPGSTLKCFADEIKVLIEEWTAVRGIARFKLNTELEKLALSFDQTESRCRQCELLKEEKAETFLEGLRSTLEMMNSQHCHRTVHAPPKRLHLFSSL